MIKINLLRDVASPKGGRGEGTFAGTSFGTSTSSVGAVDFKDLLIKFGLIILPVIFLTVYDEVIVSQKKAELEAITAQSAKVDEDLKKLAPQVTEVEKFLQDKKALDAQLSTIKTLSKERLRIVKSLDAIQSLIPQKVWLTELVITDNKVEIEGRAIEDIAIADFMRDIEDSVFFMNVNLAGSEELRFAEGSIKKFDIKCNLENL
jgi:hypothetical protein